MKRRKFLTSVGAAGAAVTAGCLSETERQNLSVNSSIITDKTPNTNVTIRKIEGVSSSTGKDVHIIIDFDASEQPRENTFPVVIEASVYDKSGNLVSSAAIRERDTNPWPRPERTYNSIIIDVQIPEDTEFENISRVTLETSNYSNFEESNGL